MNELPLKDIHLPDASLWWPPAPGWWFLLLLLIGLLMALPKVLRWLRFKPVKSLSLKELSRIQQQYRQQADSRQALQAATSLLRRTVMSRDGRTGNAGLVGESWIDRLNELSSVECFSESQVKLLTQGRYQAVLDDDIDSLLTSCKQWIQSLPRESHHAAD